jgi:hypothetical protein
VSYGDDEAVGPGTLALEEPATRTLAGSLPDFPDLSGEDFERVSS